MSRFDWWQSRTIEDIQEEAAARPVPEIRIPEIGEATLSTECEGGALTEADFERARNELIYGSQHSPPPQNVYMSPAMYKRYEAMFAQKGSTKTLSPKAKKRARRKAKKKQRIHQGISMETKVVLPYAKADAEITTKLHAQFVGSLDTLVVADPILRPDTAYLIGDNEVIHVTNIGTKK